MSIRRGGNKALRGVATLATSFHLVNIDLVDPTFEEKIKMIR